MGDRKEELIWVENVRFACLYFPRVRVRLPARVISRRNGDGSETKKYFALGVVNKLCYA